VALSFSLYGRRYCFVNAHLVRQHGAFISGGPRGMALSIGACSNASSPGTLSRSCAGSVLFWWGSLPSFIASNQLSSRAWECGRYPWPLLRHHV
jgi:hypothetical protein